MSDKNNSPLIEVKNLKMYFDISTGVFSSKPLKAVDDVSFSINKGETLGLVGESGCGKTTVGRTLLHLYKPTSGEIIYDGKPLKTKADINEYRKKNKFKELTGKEIDTICENIKLDITDTIVGNNLDIFFNDDGELRGY